MKRAAPTVSWYLSMFFIATGTLISTWVQASEPGNYEEIEWVQLMPKEDLDILLNPPDMLLGIEDGSELDSIDALSEVAQEDEAVRRFQEALTSQRVIESFDNKKIRIPGFVVPLMTDEDKRVTEFFIVPYFGACLHMPPPPPNQMIHGKVKKGFELSQLNEPFWFEGSISIEITDNALGTSAYGMSLDNISVYE